MKMLDLSRLQQVLGLGATRKNSKQKRRASAQQARGIHPIKRTHRAAPKQKPKQKPKPKPPLVPAVPLRSPEPQLYAHRATRAPPRRHTRQRFAPPPQAPVRRAPAQPTVPLSVSSFNTADYSELFGVHESEFAGLTAVPKPGRPVRRGSTRESVHQSGLGGGRPGGEPDLVVIDGAQIGSTGRNFDTDALYAALHFYTRIGMRSVAVMPMKAFDSGLGLSDRQRLRTDMLRGRIMVSPPTSRHELFVRDVARRFRSLIVTNGGVPSDLAPRTITFTPVRGSYSPRNGPGLR